MMCCHKANTKVKVKGIAVQVRHVVKGGDGLHKWPPHPMLTATGQRKYVSGT